MDAKQADDWNNSDEDFKPDQRECSPSDCVMTFRDTVDWFCLVQEVYRAKLGLFGDRGNDPTTR